MGRIGRSYPRFAEAEPRSAPPEGRDGLRSRVIGAVVGLLAALGLIGWLVTGLD